jgi:multidrug efflux pump subunit AcrB
VPALVSTLCICIVFLPMFFLGGVARYLFVPLAEAVVFAMLASYILSRTLVPTLAMYLLNIKTHFTSPSNVSTLSDVNTPSQFASGGAGGFACQGVFPQPGKHAGKRKSLPALFQQSFNRAFEHLRAAYQRTLEKLIAHRRIFIPLFLAPCLCAFLLIPWLGQDFFPSTDSGQFILHVRAPSGRRIEETARLCDLVETYIRRQVPASELDNILDNIGLPYSTMNTQHLTNGMLGAGDADIMVSLKEQHRPTANYVAALRTKLPRVFPGATFYFLPADITTQILNFGLPAPLDIQFEGDDAGKSYELANAMLAKLRRVPGLTDVRVQQPFDYPTLDIAVDRTKASQGGFTERDVTTSVLNTLSGSFQVTPMFFLNWKNGVNYNLVAQTPQYKMDAMQDLQNIPINRNTAGVNTAEPATQEILADIAAVKRNHEMAVVNHYNIRRVVDIYGAVQGRDLGAVGRDVENIIDAGKSSLPRGTFVSLHGQVDTMRSSYVALLAGLAFAIILVYLLIVVNFQSWLDPFIIITALPAALAGIVLFLFVTRTTLSVPAWMGAIMCMGVATANSILVVSFAKQKLAEHADAVRAALEAGATRFRPVLMTALAMIIGMVPMALGLGDGGEQNAPLGRAVIGGLLCATIATLVFVPSIFALIHGRVKSHEQQ